MRQRPRFASQVRTERILIISMPDSSICARLLFVDQLTGFDDERAATRLIQLVRILDVLGGEVADDALGQRLDHVLAFLQRGHLETLDRTAILFA